MDIFAGIRIIDVTQFISGSRCTQILADMGAEVVKIEPPQGDVLRLIFSLIPGAERNYSVLNRNKYGMALDWKQPQGQEIMRRLAATADIFVHNLIPGALEDSHLGYEDLKRVKPDIIYVAISGFGATGVNPERAAFDIIAQATAGQLWNDLENLMPPANYWGDFVSGSYAAMAACMALIHRLRTGEGQYVDISMQDVLYFNNYRAMMDKAMAPIMEDATRTLGRRPSEVLNSKDRMPFYGFFKTTERQGGHRGHYPPPMARPRRGVRPSRAGERSALLQPDHPDQSSRRGGRAHRRVDEPTYIGRDRPETREARKIPCGIAYSVDQVNADDHLRERGMFQTVDHAQFGSIDVPGIPYHFSSTPGKIRRPAPGLGEHNRVLLTDWLGYTADEITRLQSAKVIL